MCGLVSPCTAYRLRLGATAASPISHRDRDRKGEKVAPLTAPQRAAIVARVRARVVPSFTSIHYGDPGYAQLHLKCPVEIQTGAEDGAEMGVFCHLKPAATRDKPPDQAGGYLPWVRPGIFMSLS